MVPESELFTVDELPGGRGNQQGDKISSNTTYQAIDPDIPSYTVRPSKLGQSRVVRRGRRHLPVDRDKKKEAERFPWNCLVVPEWRTPLESIENSSYRSDSLAVNQLWLLTESLWELPCRMNNGNGKEAAAVTLDSRDCSCLLHLTSPFLSFPFLSPIL